MVVISLIFFFRRSNPASMMPRWVFISPGLPSGLPGENLRDKILGGLANSIRSERNVVHTVLIPEASIPLAISPTD
jgi:hypothetical protein